MHLSVYIFYRLTESLVSGGPSMAFLNYTFACPTHKVKLYCFFNLTLNNFSNLDCLVTIWLTAFYDFSVKSICILFNGLLQVFFAWINRMLWPIPNKTLRHTGSIPAITTFFRCSKGLIGGIKGYRITMRFVLNNICMQSQTQDLESKRIGYINERQVTRFWLYWVCRYGKTPNFCLICLYWQSPWL